MTQTNANQTYRTWLIFNVTYVMKYALKLSLGSYQICVTILLLMKAKLIHMIV